MDWLNRWSKKAKKKPIPESADDQEALVDDRESTSDAKKEIVIEKVIDTDRRHGIPQLSQGTLALLKKHGVDDFRFKLDLSESPHSREGCFLLKVWNDGSYTIEGAPEAAKADAKIRMQGEWEIDPSRNIHLRSTVDSVLRGQVVSGWTCREAEGRDAMIIRQEATGAELEALPKYAPDGTFHCYEVRGFPHGITMDLCIRVS